MGGIQHLYSLLQPSEQDLQVLPILQKVFYYYERNTLIQARFPLQNGPSHYIQTARENSSTLLFPQSASALHSAYGVIKRFPQLAARDTELLHLIERSSFKCSNRVHPH